MAHSNSVTAQIAAFQSAAEGDIPVPETVNLRPGDLRFWLLVTRARARDEWSEVDLQLAGQLARCMADIERISAEVETEGDVVTNDRGTRVVNPKRSLVTVLIDQQTRLITKLQLHAAVLNGRPTQVANKREAEQEARAAVADMQDDDLLAKPGVRLQ